MEVRDTRFDFTRSICVLWIVCFWHVLFYLPKEYHLEDNEYNFLKYVTHCVLATFTFLSGFFLQKYRFHSISDIVLFYKKRLLRFYPLYALSVISLGVTTGCGFYNIVESLLGYSVLTSPMPTLWYFSMLFLFYLFTPALVFECEMWYRYLLLPIFIAVIFFADNRCLLYIPFYVLGLNISNSKIYFVMNKMRKYLYFSLFVNMFLFFFYIFLHLFIQESILKVYIQMLLGLYLIVSTSYLICPLRFSKLINYIAFSSMCAYLFHRQIYSSALIIFRSLLGLDAIPLFFAVIVMVSIFIFSYNLQRLYNNIINIYNGKFR